MSLPAKAKTWIIDPCNRIAFTSLLQTMGAYVFEVTTFLLANGYTCKGSSTGAAAAMDATNRITTSTSFNTRAANTTTAQSWIVFVGGNGENILITYTGAADDVCRISFSPGGLMTVAGTATFAPTATDECVITLSTTVIGATASGDRLWSGWIDSQAKLCRFAICRSAVFVSCWGVELVSSTVGGAIAFTPPIWGFSYDRSGIYYAGGGSNGVCATFTASTRGGRARANAIVGDFGGGAEFHNFAVAEASLQPTLQGGGYIIKPLSIWGVTASCNGKLGNRIDWWGGRDGSAIVDGDIYGNGEFITFNGTLWPWDGTPGVPGTTVVMT